MNGPVACIPVDIASDLLERCARASLLELVMAVVVRIMNRFDPSSINFPQ
jgi:hypothetical protein